MLSLITKIKLEQMAYEAMFATVVCENFFSSSLSVCLGQLVVCIYVVPCSEHFGFSPKVA
jgi:hypothetical protein